MINRFTKRALKGLYNGLAQKDADLKKIINEYGYPPLWVRPNTFETLVLTILEQQVSLASAYAAYKRLKGKINVIEPEAFLQLTDEELRTCSFSRQKIGYVRGLAAAILNNEINLEHLVTQTDDEVRRTLKSLKGIGDWTVDIYLLHTLQRADIFPTGDLALVNALKMVKGLSAPTSKEDLLQISAPWHPYRSIATMLLWHYYIQKRGIILAY